MTEMEKKESKKYSLDDMDIITGGEGNMTPWIGYPCPKCGKPNLVAFYEESASGLPQARCLNCGNIIGVDYILAHPVNK